MGGKKLATPKGRSGSANSKTDKLLSNSTAKAKPKSLRKVETPAAKSGTPRVRRRASDFASKKRSSKKRPRDTPDSTEAIDETLAGLRGALHSKKKDAERGISETLLSALKRAKDAYEDDESGPSSDDSGEGIEVGKRKKPQVSAKKMTPKSEKLRTPTTMKKDNPKKRLFNSPDVSGNGSLRQTGEGSGLVTPKHTNKKREKTQRSTAKKSKREAGRATVTASAHKRDIEALKKEDPDFYKFLEENDTTLLDFDDEDELGDIDQSEDEKENEDSPHEEESDVDSEPEKETPKNESDVSASEGDEDESDDDEADTKGTAIPTAVGDDVKGYSDSSEDEEDERRAEEEAAAEAGLDVNGTAMDSSDSEHEDGGVERAEAESEEMEEDLKEEKVKKGNKRMIFVDMAYLQTIKKQLRSNRSSLEAAKDLLRLFRAGKEILPAKVDSQRQKHKSKDRSKIANDGQSVEAAEVGADEFADDGSFTAGKVRFASAKAYQQALNLAISGIQDALDRMLGKPKDVSDERQISKWDPSESGRWMNLQRVFQSYVFHMLSLCDVVTDPATSRFLMKRLEKLVPYTRENKVLLKKIVKVAIRVWSADALHMSEPSRLRAYLLLNKLAHGPGNAEVVLRSCCAAYASSIANVCNPRTLPTIQFAATCIVELFSIDMGASYSTAFANLREIAISLRAVMVSKQEKEEVERIHNWSFINRLRLWSMVLGKYGAEDELKPLIYPYVQVSLGVMRVYATPRTFPLRFHVASYLSDVIAQTGTYIPLAPHLLSLLRCSELRKKPVHGNSKALEWRSVLRVSNDVIKTKPFVSGVIDGVVFQLAKFFATISKHVSFPEISHMAEVALRKFAKEVVVQEWKEKIMGLVEKLHQTSDAITEARAKADFSPQGAVSKEGMLSCVPGMDPDKKTPIQRFFEVESTRIRKQEKLRDEKIVTNQGAASKKISAENDDSSDSDNSEVPSEPSAKRARKSGSQNGGHPTKKIKQKLSIVGSDDDEEPDIVQDLDMDSEDSDEEQ
ncbi:unnamed protein product [Chondrus crispus]|uniref:Nucleolar complex protein 2 n=1 Tax=Chondrus crispus TaxID=2769 RepID=R7QF52_CHOCR|nr:unnamed protein product [Chondrus crispus]CDF36030.1 unnamed protein product [Chondrus crispus]|eukprot:XP_005715849.1 unnamed protein product [Chondrus crispus]